MNASPTGADRPITRTRRRAELFDGAAHRFPEGGFSSALDWLLGA